MSRNIYGFLFLVLLYADSVFLAIEGLVSVSQHHFESIFIVYSIILVYVAFIITFSKIVLNNCKMNSTRILFLEFMLCLVVSFWCTQYQFDEINSRYLNAFLIMGVRLLPVVAVACIAAFEDYYKMIEFIPVLVILFAVSATISILKAGGFGLRISLYNNEINTYQSLGYYMAYAYSLSISYLSCERKWKENRYLINLAMILFIPLEWFALLTLGGKGPILVAIAATVIVLISYTKGRKLLLLLIVVMIILAPCYFPIIYQFAGIQRLLNIKFDLSTLERLHLWQGAIEAGINKIFLGNGLGSEYYLLGFYSHNMLLDIFMEVGLFGFLFFSAYLINICIWMIQFVKRDRKYIVLAVIFFNSLIMLMVSGYYLFEAAFWGGIAYVIAHKKSVLSRKK